MLICDWHEWITAETWVWLVLMRKYCQIWRKERTPCLAVSFVHFLCFHFISILLARFIQFALKLCSIGCWILTAVGRRRIYGCDGYGYQRACYFRWQREDHFDCFGFSCQLGSSSSRYLPFSWALPNEKRIVKLDISFTYRCFQRVLVFTLFLVLSSYLTSAGLWF